MRTMSDFIMEQETTTSGYDNDMEIMEGFMQLSAISAVAECYCEHAAIAEFATESGLNVFTESDDNIMKKAWDATKTFFSKIWEWLKSVVNGIIRFFTKSSVDRLIVKLKSLKNEGKLKNTTPENRFNDYTDELEWVDVEVLKGINPNSLDVDEIFNLVQEFSEAIKKGGEAANDTAIKSFIDRAENFLKKDTVKEKFKQDDDKKMTVEAIIAVLERMSRADIPSKGRKLLKKLDFDKNDYKKGGTGDDKDKIDKDLVKSIKKAANLVAKAYDTYVDNTVKLVNKVLKKNLKETDYKTRNEFESDAYKDLDKAKKESYEENTDGYFFL